MSKTENSPRDMTPPPANAKTYDGSFVVSHVIQAGESLSRIAAIYRCRRWEPIWTYNSEIEKILTDQDQIRKGVTIFIPRSKAGYDKLIRKLEALSDQLEAQGDMIQADLDRDLNLLKADKVALNFVGDVAGLLAGLALKVGQVGKLTKVAEKSAGQAKIAARLAARKEARDLAAKYAAARSRLLKDALHGQKDMWAAKKAVREFYKDRAIDTAVKVADDRYGHITGQEDVTPFKDVKQSSDSAKGR